MAQAKRKTTGILDPQELARLLRDRMNWTIRLGARKFGEGGVTAYF